MNLNRLSMNSLLAAEAATALALEEQAQLAFAILENVADQKPQELTTAIRNWLVTEAKPQSKTNLFKAISAATGWVG